MHKTDIDNGQPPLVAGAPGGKRVIEKGKLAPYTLAELLTLSDYSSPRAPDEQERIDAPRDGRELF